MWYWPTSRTWRKWIGSIVNFFRLTRRHAWRGRCSFGSATAARSSAWRWQAEELQPLLKYKTLLRSASGALRRFVASRAIGTPRILNPAPVLWNESAAVTAQHTCGRAKTHGG